VVACLLGRFGQREGQTPACGGGPGQGGGTTVGIAVGPSRCEVSAAWGSAAGGRTWFNGLTTVPGGWDSHRGGVWCARSAKSEVGGCA